MIVINYNLIKLLMNDLEMNGRQFILREQKIKELKAEGTYPTHDIVDDLIYFHIKSAMIYHVIECIYRYLDLRNSTDTSEVVFREFVINSYGKYCTMETHEQFFNRRNPVNL